MPVCPQCFTHTETVATAECIIPACLGPATPRVACTRTLDLRQTTATVVANDQVCPYTPTVTEISRCPAATACNEVDCVLLTLGENDWTTGPTRHITNCRPSLTPWTQATPVGWVPDPTKAPSDLSMEEEGTLEPMGESAPEEGPYEQDPVDAEWPAVESQQPAAYESWPTIDVLHPPSPGGTGTGTGTATRDSGHPTDAASASPVTPASTDASASQTLPSVAQSASAPLLSSSPTITDVPAETTSFSCLPADYITEKRNAGCPQVSCHSVTATCGSEWTSRPKRSTVTETWVRDCTSVLRTLTIPCPMCATCLGHGGFW